MASVRITVNSKPYTIDCGEGQEDRVKELAKYIDTRMASVKNNSAAMAEDQLFMITSLILADEIFEAKENGATVSADTPAASTEGMVPEEKVSAIIEEVSTRISQITKQVEAL